MIILSSATHRLIPAKDHAAIQINFAQVDNNGVSTGEVISFAVIGYLRQQGRSDEAINRLATEAGLLQNVYRW